MNKPTKVLVDCSTGVSTQVELTDEEIAAIEESQLIAEELENQRKAEAEAKAQAKASALAKLTTLGLSEDEANALIR